MLFNKLAIRESLPFGSGLTRSGDGSCMTPKKPFMPGEKLAPNDHF